MTPEAQQPPLPAPQGDGQAVEAPVGHPDAQRAREARYAEAVISADPPAGIAPRRVEAWLPEARAVMAVADEEQAELRAEVERLRRWKAEATEVILGLQDLGKALGIRPGERITGHSATEAAQRLTARIAELEAALQRSRDAHQAAEVALADARRQVEAVLDPDVTWRCSACGWVASEETIRLALWPERDKTVSMVCPECEAEGAFVDHEPLVEDVAALVHEAWMAAKAAQGVTSRPSEWGEEQMVPYADLSERAKDLDRSTVRAVLDALRTRLSSAASDAPEAAPAPTTEGGE